jgi:ATP-dependent RNA helicase DeaD
VHNVQVNEQQIEQYLPRIMDEFKDLSKEEIIKRFASLEFNSFLDYYKNAPDLNAPVDDSRRMDSTGSGDRFNRTGMRSDFTRLFINLGSVDGFSRGDLLGYICNTAKISGRTVGKIDVKGVYSFFEVPNEDSEKVMNGFKGADFQGRDVRIEISGESSNESRGGASNYKRREGGDRRDGGFRRDGGNREGGNRERSSAPAGGGGFRDFSGKRREDRSSGNGERRRRF